MLARMRSRRASVEPSGPIHVSSLQPGIPEAGDAFRQTVACLR